MKTLSRYAIALASSYAAGLFGYLFVTADSLEWYAGLVKPVFTPPSSVFLPAWLALYALMGLAVGAVWSKLPFWDAWAGLSYVSLAFNASWTIFFFGLHAVFIALVDVAALFVLLLVLALTAWETDHRASILMLPYALWVAFAMYLNAAIWLLN